MRQVPNPSQGLICFELTQDQALHIAASLASDLDNASNLMPAMFEMEHVQLCDMFMAKLSEHHIQFNN